MRRAAPAPAAEQPDARPREFPVATRKPAPLLDDDAPREMRLFVGGLSGNVSANDLQGRFTPFGTVHRVEMIEGKALGVPPLPDERLLRSVTAMLSCPPTRSLRRRPRPEHSNCVP